MQSSRHCTRHRRQAEDNARPPFTAEELGGGREPGGPLDCGTNLAELLTSALPPDKKAGEARVVTPPAAHSNGSGDGSECASTSSVGSGGRAPPRALLPRALEHDEHAAHAVCATVLQEVAGNKVDDFQLDTPLNLVASLDRDLSDGEGLLGGSAPVNIPQARAGLRGFSPPSGGSPLPPFLRYDTERLFNSHAIKAGSFGGGGSFEYASASPEVSRLREELASNRAAVARWDERIAQARSACEAWKREAEDAARAASVAERQRDDALAHARALRRELDGARAALAPRPNLRSVPLTQLKAMQVQARADLEEIEKVLYLETATKCMVCEEQPRSVTLAPCNHYVLCDKCAATTEECPYCQTPVQHMQ